MTENFLYFLSFPKDITSLVVLIIIRTLFSAVLHCCTQAVFGAAIGFAKFKGPLAKMFIIPLGLGVAMFMHFMWNLTVSFNETALIGFAFMIISVIVIFVVFQIGVYQEGKIILKELAEESNTTGYIPKEHLAHLPYTSRRYKKGWLPGHINQKDYVKSAIKLALRRHQEKSVSQKAKKAYLVEIDLLRKKIYVINFGSVPQQQQTV